MRRVCVFCGSRPTGGLRFRPVATELGQLIAASGMELVYGGSSIGLMGHIADATLAAGGRVIGVIPDFLVAKEIAHPGLTELHVVGSMHERKALMASLSDGFVAMPGGFGTLEEYFEVLTWSQLSLHDRPCGLLNVSGFFDGLIAFFDRAVDEDLLRTEHRALVLQHAEPSTLLAMLAEYRRPQAEARA